MALRFQNDTKAGTVAMGTGKAVRVFIYDNEFSGSWQAVTFAAPTMRFRYDGGGQADPADPIKTSTCTMYLLVDSVDLYSFVVEVARANPFRFGVKIQYDGNNFWCGYLDAQQITAPFTCKTDFVAELVATDMLANTKFIDQPNIASATDWLQYFAPIFIDASTGRDGLNFYDLLGTGTDVLVVATQMCEARFSEYFDRALESIDWRYQLGTDGTLFDFLKLAAGQLNMRIFQRNQKIYIIERPLMVGTETLNVLLYDYDDTTEVIEYNRAGTESVGHEPINMSNAFMQYLPAVNEVVAEYEGTGGTDEFTHQNTNTQINVERFTLGRLDQLTTNHGTFAGNTHLAYGGWLWINSGAYGFTPMSFGTWATKSWLAGWQLITNGQFGTTSTTGWSASSLTISATGGQFTMVCTNDGSDENAATSITTVNGTVYVLSVEVTENTAPLTFKIGVGTGTTSSNWDDISSTSASTLQNYTITFTATGSTTYINLIIVGTLDTERVKVANVKCYKKSNLQPLAELVAEQRALMQYRPPEILSASFHDWFDFLQPIQVQNKFYWPHKMDVDVHDFTITGEWFFLWERYFVTFSNYTPNNTVGLNGAENNRVFKNSGTDAWGNLADVDGELVAPWGGLSFRMYGDAQTTSECAIGLDQNVAAATTYANLDFCIYLGGSGTNSLIVYENGVSKYTESWTFSTTDVFTIHHNGRFIEYRKNGVVFYRSAATITTPLGALVDNKTDDGGFQNVFWYGNNIQY